MNATVAHIVYGISGEGSGHSSRAREILNHLQSRGHQVKVATYDRGYHNLQHDFDCLEIAGLTIVSRDNQVSPLRTLTHNLAAIPSGKESLATVRHHLFKAFTPDCVVTDFEPMTAYLAHHYDIPLITLDNQHRLRYMVYPCPKRYKKDALLTEALIRAMVPKPDVSLITTFYFDVLKNTRSFLFPPILRQAVLQLQPTQGDHVLVLVYVTAGFESLLDELSKFTREQFWVYGYERNDRVGPLQFKPFSQDGFLQDLAAAKGVITTAGFTLITKSLYLGKPYLALPMSGQFEQILNSLMLSKLGYGCHALRLDRNTVAAYLYHLPEYAAALDTYDRQVNQAITRKLDALLADDCRELRTFHEHRR